MTSFFITLMKFLSAFFRGLRDREFRIMFIVLVGLLISGTFFYASHEGWSLVDSLYFSVITLTTVGYGDLHPTTTWSKLFTIIYIMVGVGIVVAFLTKMAEQSRSGKKRNDEE